jgi:hypothetical protein
MASKRDERDVRAWEATVSPEMRALRAASDQAHEAYRGACFREDVARARAYAAPADGPAWDALREARAASRRALDAYERASGDFVSALWAAGRVGP